MVVDDVDDEKMSNLNYTQWTLTELFFPIAQCKPILGRRAEHPGCMAWDKTWYSTCHFQIILFCFEAIMAIPFFQPILTHLTSWHDLVGLGPLGLLLLQLPPKWLMDVSFPKIRLTTACLGHWQYGSSGSNPRYGQIHSNPLKSHERVWTCLNQFMFGEVPGICLLNALVFSWHI